MIGNDPNEEPGVCPTCGCTSEDFVNYDNVHYECPECGLQMTDDEIVSKREFRYEARRP